MTRNDLFRCMDAVDDEVLARSENTAGIEAKRKRARWIAAAACLCLILGGALWLRGRQDAAPVVEGKRSADAGAHAERRTVRRRRNRCRRRNRNCWPARTKSSACPAWDRRARKCRI